MADTITTTPEQLLNLATDQALENISEQTPQLRAKHPGRVAQGKRLAELNRQRRESKSSSSSWIPIAVAGAALGFFAITYFYVNRPQKLKVIPFEILPNEVDDDPNFNNVILPRRRRARS